MSGRNLNDSKELEEAKKELREKLKERLRIKTKGDQIARSSKFARDNLEIKLKNEKKPTKASKHFLRQIEEKNEKELTADGCEMFLGD